MRSWMSWFSDVDWKKNYWELLALWDDGRVDSTLDIEKM